VKPVRAVLFANGDYVQQSAARVVVSDNDFLVCVDGGIRHCLAEGFTPNLLVGDLDSLDSAAAELVQRLPIECVRFPAEKDASDLELALQELSDRGLSEVVLLGASGGRTDHHLFNWQLVGRQSWPFTLRIVDATVDVYLVDNERPFDSNASLGQVFSVIPTSGCATGVCVHGAQYPLDNASLPVGSTIGLSNVVNRPRLQVSVEAGIVLVMLVIFE